MALQSGNSNRGFLDDEVQSDAGIGNDFDTNVGEGKPRGFGPKGGGLVDCEKQSSPAGGMTRDADPAASENIDRLIDDCD